MKKPSSLSKTVFPWLSLPILGPICFFFKRRKTEAIYALFAMGLALYGYTIISMILGYVVIEVFPYFLESFLHVCLKLNTIVITFGFLLMAMSEIFQFEETLLGYFPILVAFRRILMEEH